MKNVTIILQATAKILTSDISLFRKIILDSGGGELPDTIKEKQKLLRDIEKALDGKSRKK